MKQYKIAFSSTPPIAGDVLWAMPVTNGFTLKARVGGQWKPIKLLEDNGTIDEDDDTVMTIVEKVKVNGTELTPSNNVVNVTIIEGTTNGTLKVNGSNVKVHGLGTAAYKAEGYFQKAVATGTFDNVPTTPNTGTMYWCTSTMTSTNLGEDGVANIPIFYNGTGWVDYLGATVTEVVEDNNEEEPET